MKFYVITSEVKNLLEDGIEADNYEVDKNGNVNFFDYGVTPSGYDTKYNIFSVAAYAWGAVTKEKPDAV